MIVFNLQLKRRDGQYFVAVATVSKTLSSRQSQKTLPWRLFQKTLPWHQNLKFRHGTKL
jgi:hypothetical protein